MGFENHRLFHVKPLHDGSSGPSSIRLRRSWWYRHHATNRHGQRTPEYRDHLLVIRIPPGPNQPVEIELQLADDDNLPASGTVAMTVGGRAVGNVQIAGHANRGTLNAVQGDALLHAILKDDHFARGSGTTRWVVSTAGANAVLPPLPVPLVHAADVLGKSPLARPFAPADLPDLRTALRAAVKGADCDLLDSQAPGDAKIDAWQLQTARLLVSHRCWSGAYNSGDGYRVIARRPPYAPVFVTDAATGYENGEVTSSEQGPGIGDCWATASCTWDGKSFVQTHMANSGMCREIAAGGAWTMPTLVMRLDKRR